MSTYVSIITPCYNAERFISQAIDSVINQTFQHWEMIIIDDCSCDNSRQIIEQYTDKDSRIKYLKTDSPSGSPSLPRNIGIENATGKYIAFLDADDIWHPDKLAKQLKFIESKKCDLVYSYYEKIDCDGKRNNRIVRTSKQTTYNDILKSNSIPCLTSIISRKAIGTTRFKQIPQEDFCFWLDILKKGYKAYNLCEVTAFYRESNASRSANKLDMFRGYWNVIRNQQGIPFLLACCYMLTYTYLGFAKFLK